MVMYNIAHVNRNTANTRDAKFVQQYILTMLMMPNLSTLEEFILAISIVILCDMYSYVQLWCRIGPIWRIIFQEE